MSNISIESVYKRIRFVNRYETICKKHNDFENSLSGNNHGLYSMIISKLGYNAKYYKIESFYRIEEKSDNLVFGLQLGLKNGMVEVMIDMKLNDSWCVPDGRIDFLCEELDSSFDRDRFNIPKYTSEAELEEILKEIFSIYEDVKKEMIKESRKDEDS